MVDLHRHLSLLALLATGVHGTALLFDATIDIGPLALVVPGLIPYRPLWTGLGVIAAELAVLIHISFYLRTRIGGRNWRRLHWLTYLLFAFGALHGIMSGTDTGTVWAMAVYAGAISAVVGLTGWRAVNFRRSVPKRNPSMNSERQDARMPRSKDASGATA
jgi:predicted ferric reductase